MDLVEWWKEQLRKIGQRFEDNPNGIQFVQASTVETAPAPEYVAVSPIASLCTPGVLLSRNTSTGALSWTTQFQNGVAPVTEASAATISTSLQSQIGYDAYASDGAATRTVSIVESYARAYTCAADGSLASAELLPAAGAGLKWVIWDLYTTSRASLTGGTGGQAALSDMGSGKGSLIEFPIYGCLCHPGPYKQGTANTAINISAVAGKFTNNSLVFVTLRCAKVA